ncbi:diguanylate cyclase [Sphingomonas sp. SORGH_AS_0870]|uniref:GGDEF domain-containing protein n=1 Tax=Sphingomonas sp. SORGH_AS_0870 TaxID=3041801 RepID=UPI00286B3509|nr:diguanylate cyclase [Sphingomonas sp. SORGH_AS_0870]
MPDRPALEDALSRLTSSIRLTPRLERDFDRYRADSVRSQVVYVLATLLVLTLFGVIVDMRVGVLALSLYWKLSVQLPSIVLALILVGQRRIPPHLIWLAGAIPFVITVGLVTRLSLAVPSPMAEQLSTTALATAFTANLILPIKVRPAILVALANMVVYLGLPLAIAPRTLLFQSVDILAFHAAMILATPIGAYFNERVQKQSFLLTLIQQRQSSELEAAVEELTRMSHRDPLTGAGNRRSMDIRYARLRQTARMRGDAIRLILIDVDHFKLFNDAAGHAAGDRCLQAVTKAIARGANCPIEMVTRFGGEEFALLLPWEEIDIAEGIRRQVEAMALPHPGLPPGRVVTVSIGQACLDPGRSDATQDDLFRWADEALYRAKRDGRNRVAIADEGARAAG